MGDDLSTASGGRGGDGEGCQAGDVGVREVRLKYLAFPLRSSLRFGWKSGLWKSIFEAGCRLFHV